VSSVRENENVYVPAEELSFALRTRLNSATWSHTRGDHHMHS
jgi:hypothetical protein